MTGITKTKYSEIYHFPFFKYPDRLIALFNKNLSEDEEKIREKRLKIKSIIESSKRQTREENRLYEKIINHEYDIKEIIK